VRLLREMAPEEFEALLREISEDHARVELELQRLERLLAAAAALDEAASQVLALRERAQKRGLVTAEQAQGSGAKTEPADPAEPRGS